MWDSSSWGAQWHGQASRLASSKELDGCRIEVADEDVPDRRYQLVWDRAMPRVYLEWHVNQDGFSGFMHFRFFADSPDVTGLAVMPLKQFAKDAVMLSDAVTALRGIKGLEGLRSNEDLLLGDEWTVAGHHFKVVLNPNRRNVVFGQVPKERTFEIDGEIFEDLPIPHSSDLSIRGGRLHGDRARHGLLVAELASELQAAVGATLRSRRGLGGTADGLTG